MRRRFPRPLLPGMTVGLIAPASPVFEPDRRDAAVRLLEDMGYRVRRGASVDAVDWCFSGTDAIRARDVMDMFLDDTVDGIVCLRGGYGCLRMMDRLDFAAIARHPKAFVGFSDVTALHAALYERCGLVTYHGPMPGLMTDVGLREPRARAQWLQAVTGQLPRRIANPDGAPFGGEGSGPVTGRLIGGNLTVLCNLIGTPWEPDWTDKLLLIEDVAERTDHLDSMILRLKTCGALDSIAGLVIGDFSRYAGMTSPRQLPLSRIIADRISPDLPVLYGLHAGHGRDRMTLVLGAHYRLDPCAASLTLLESYTR